MYYTYIINPGGAKMADNQQSTDTISARFSADHARLQTLWDRCVDAIRACDPDGVLENFTEFEAGLRRHIRAEEDALFPAFERATGMGDRGPTSVMRMEHREIELMLDSLRDRARARDCATLYGQHVGPAALFKSHDAKEEGVLYPMADRMVNRDERERVLAALRG
jgi:hemerythrin superfamily protein